MFTVNVHNASIGILPLDRDGRMNRNKPYMHVKFSAAKEVAKAYANKHKITACVHNPRGKVLKMFRPEPVSFKNSDEV